VAISPETEKAVRELGFPVAAVATTYTTEGLIEAIVGHASRADTA
jgi:uroporphyrinogen III methyltransferase / synthase